MLPDDKKLIPKEISFEIINFKHKIYVTKKNIKKEWDKKHVQAYCSINCVSNKGSSILINHGKYHKILEQERENEEK